MLLVFSPQDQILVLPAVIPRQVRTKYSQLYFNMHTYPEQQKLYMPYLVKYILSTSLSSLHRNASTGCAVTSMTEYETPWTGSSDGWQGSRVLESCAWCARMCLCGGGTSGHCRSHAGREREEWRLSCRSAGLQDPSWRHDDNWVTK